jgi:hypothetical protein
VNDERKDAHESLVHPAFIGICPTSEAGFIVGGGEGMYGVKVWKVNLACVSQFIELRHISDLSYPYFLSCLGGTFASHQVGESRRPSWWSWMPMSSRRLASTFQLQQLHLGFGTACFLTMNVELYTEDLYQVVRCPH